MDVRPPSLYLACHCQENIFRINIPAAELIASAVVYDCNQCIKRRGLWADVDPVRMDHLRGYHGPGMSRRAYCHTCGTTLLRFPYRINPNPPHNEIIGINLRAVRSENVNYFDAHVIIPRLVRDEHPPGFEPVSLYNDLPGAEFFLRSRGDGQIHLAACPCKLICFAWMGNAIEDDQAWDCGCAICLGNGTVWFDPGRENTYFYPHEPDDPSTPRQDLVVRYAFGPGLNGHHFCARCGVAIYEENLTKGRDGWAFNGMLAAEAPNFLVDLYNLPIEAIIGRPGQKKIRRYNRHVYMRARGEPYRIHAEPAGQPGEALILRDLMDPSLGPPSLGPPSLGPPSLGPPSLGPVT